MSERTYGFTKSGKPIDDEMIQELADEAERGYKSGQLERHRRGPGRPPIGDAAKSVESVRLDPDLHVEFIRKAVAEGVTVSEFIRRALSQYLHGVSAFFLFDSSPAPLTSSKPLLGRFPRATFAESI